ncbi:MAG: metallophosphoesterase, partial [Lachnospiraceae bacterium]|nr:metallophosphoesterase [Lachnospiraceae bacterium]
MTESLRFKVTDYCVKSKKIPEALKGKKIAVLADLHCTHFGKGNRRLFSRLSMLAPDFIVIAGDLVNGHEAGEFEYATETLEGLKELNIPVYYAYGNHETKFLLRENNLCALYDDLIDRSPCKVLRNAGCGLCPGARIYGLELALGHYNANYEPDRGVPDTAS